MRLESRQPRKSTEVGAVPHPFTQRYPRSGTTLHDRPREVANRHALLTLLLWATLARRATENTRQKGRSCDRRRCLDGVDRRGPATTKRLCRPPPLPSGAPHSPA
jgi:hypothetical protein